VRVRFYCLPPGFNRLCVVVCRPDGATAAGGDTSEVVLPADAEVPALCIELVGNRFLRRMVRILTVRTHIICRTL
jgi:hypothetical protein